MARRRWLHIQRGYSSAATLEFEYRTLKYQWFWFQSFRNKSIQSRKDKFLVENAEILIFQPNGVSVEKNMRICQCWCPADSRVIVEVWAQASQFLWCALTHRWQLTQHRPTLTVSSRTLSHYSPPPPKWMSSLLFAFMHVYLLSDLIDIQINAKKYYHNSPFLVFISSSSPPHPHPLSFTFPFFTPFLLSSSSTQWSRPGVSKAFWMRY